MKKFASMLMAAAVLLAGCGSKLNGTYEGDMGNYTFKRDGTVVQEALGMKMELKYEVDGKDVKLIAPQGSVIFTLVDDKTITGPMGMKFIKKD